MDGHKKRLHVTLDQDSPTYTLYCDIIGSINAHIRGWQMTEGMSERDIHQAIGSALLSEAAHYFGNVWGHTKKDFCQMAEEEYDNHCSSKAFGGTQ